MPPSLTDWRLLDARSGLENLHQLDTSHGCQNHTLLPSAASSAKTPRPAHVLPTEIPAKAFKRRPSCAPACSLTGQGPPCDPVRARRCRVHRIPRPTSVTIAIRPSSGCGMAGVVGVIWGHGEAEYFCRGHWTKRCVICPRDNATGSGALARTPPGSGRGRREAAGEGPSPCASMLQTA